MISVICASLNCLQDLQISFNSFIAQDYKKAEFIIIDGNSKDGTKEFLASLIGEPRLKFISEPDKGVSDAFNKGIKLSSGDYLYFLGAGDTFCSRNSLSHLIDGVDKNKDDLICGRIRRLDGEHELWQAPYSWPRNYKFRKQSLLKKMSLPHQGLLTHRRFFERFGHFDENSQFAMDYELLLRAYHDFPRVILKDILVANWQTGGVGAGKLDEVLHEYHRIKKKNHVASLPVLGIIHGMNLLKFHLKTKSYR